jgi:hypothetical protein
LTDRGHPGANRQLASNKVGPARRATGLGIIIGEEHALFGYLIEVRRHGREHEAREVDKVISENELGRQDQEIEGDREEKSRRPDLSKFFDQE